MSRVGLKPIELPAGVEITVDAKNVVTVKGPKGQLVEPMDQDITITVGEKEILISRPTDNKRHRSLHGLTRALVANMVEGVSKGFEKRLEIVGVGYRAQKSGKELTLNLGFSHPVVMADPEGIETVVEGQNKIVVKGINKQQVGNYAAVIRDWRKPEPYKGKGVRYEGEYVRRKEGKTGK
jgi:large subunit ribosomal protein L6